MTISRHSEEKLDHLLNSILRNKDTRDLCLNVLKILVRHEEVRVLDLKSELMLNENLKYSTQLFRVLDVLCKNEIIVKTVKDRAGERGKPPSYYKLTIEFRNLDTVDLMSPEDMKNEIRKLRAQLTN